MDLDFSAAVDTSYKSQLFKLEVEELLNEVRPKWERIEEVETVVHRLDEILRSMPVREVVASAASHPPGFQFYGSKEVHLKVTPPQHVHIVGSYASQTLARPAMVVDVALVMPASMFLEKDFLDYRYHNKRALYLLQVAQHLQKAAADVVGSLRLQAVQGDVMRPALLASVISTRKSLSRLTLRFLPALVDHAFPAVKLNPQRVATPAYTSGIAADMALVSWASRLHDALADAPTVRDGITLLKVWARRRGLDGGSDTPNGFVLSVLTAEALWRGRITPHMSPYQVFRLMMETLVETDFATGVVISKTLPSGTGAEEVLARYAALTPGVLLDAQHQLNLLARVSESALADLRHEAQLTIRLLDDARVDGFAQVFATPVPFDHKFDAVFSIHAAPAQAVADLGPFDALRAALSQTVAQALAGRIALLRAQPYVPAEWALDQAPPAPPARVVLGVLLNPETGQRTVDRGPPADSPEAKAFVEFWGPKAQTRRFKDGSIVKAIAWEAPPSRVLHAVVTHALQRHHGLAPHAVRTLSAQLDPITAPGAGATHRIHAAFESLSKALRSLADLPLAVNAVLQAHAALRYTDVYPPEPHALLGSGPTGSVARFVDPIDVVIQLEGSARWPQDARAVYYLKMAMLLKIGQKLRREHAFEYQCGYGWLEVHVDGYAFRLRIAHETEADLLQATDPHGAAVLRRTTLYAVQHSQLMHAVASQHPAFAPTARACKRWVHAHMFSGHINDETIELLVASLFTSPAPFAAPGSAVVGFRRFLALLATANWSENPVVVDPNGVLTVDDHRAVQSAFLEHSTRGGVPYIYIVTPHDRTSQHWTSEIPTHKTLERLRAYAEQCLRMIDTGSGPTPDHWVRTTLQSVFLTPLSEYDVRLELRHVLVPHYERLAELRTLAGASAPSTAASGTGASVAATSAAAAAAAAAAASVGTGSAVTVPDRSSLRPGFNPVQFLVRDLKHRVGRRAQIYYDALGGDVVGLVWRSSFSRTEGGSDHAAIKSRLLADMRVIGEGLVQRIVQADADAAAAAAAATRASRLPKAAAPPPTPPLGAMRPPPARSTGLASPLLAAAATAGAAATAATARGRVAPAAPPPLSLLSAGGAAASAPTQTGTASAGAGVATGGKRTADGAGFGGGGGGGRKRVQQ